MTTSPAPSFSVPCAPPRIVPARDHVRRRRGSPAAECPAGRGPAPAPRVDALPAVPEGPLRLHVGPGGRRRAGADARLRRGARRRPTQARARARSAAQALDAVIAQRGGGEDDAAAETGDSSGRGRVVEQLAEFLLTLNAGCADSVGSSRPAHPSTFSRTRRRWPRRSRRRQSVLPFEPFPYPKFDPAAALAESHEDESGEDESGEESESQASST